MKRGDFTPGDRVQLHPRLGLWVSGARYGEVVKIGRSRVHVRLDALGRVRLFSPDDLTHA